MPLSYKLDNMRVYTALIRFQRYYAGLMSDVLVGIYPILEVAPGLYAYVRRTGLGPEQQIIKAREFNAYLT